MSTTEQLFEQASRLKVRFSSSLGQLSVEDLWDLPLSTRSDNRVSLDAIAIYLHKQTRDTAEMISFVTPAADTGNIELQLKFEIVKHVIAVRVAERDALKAASDRREKKQRLLELIAKKEDQSLEEKTVDELRVLAESM